VRGLAVVAAVAAAAPACTDAPAGELAEHRGTTTFLTPTEHLARASLALRGVRPSIGELREVAADPSRLPELVDRYLATPEFGDTVRELHDEALLLRIRDRQYTLPAVDRLRGATFDQVNDSIYGEPLHLIEYVVTSGRPYTDIVTADYTLADPTVARAWGLTYAGFGQWTVVPTPDRPRAGILASPALFMRYRSAGANYHRARANAVSRGLLCHDFLDSDISIDTSVNLADPQVVANAVVANPTCAGCHQALDPLASYFFPYPQGTLPVGSITAYPFAYYDPTAGDGWFGTTWRPPAYFGTPADGLAGLGAAIASDPRFARCAAIHFASYLTESTADALPPAWIAALQDHFTSAHYDARVLVRDIVMSDEFRTASDDDAQAALATIGYQKVRPPQLARMIEDLTGFAWTADSPAVVGIGPYWRQGTYDVLDDDTEGYRVLAGGLDDYLVTRPVLTSTTTSSLVTRDLAYRAAAFVVSHDATAAAGARTLFAGSPGAEPASATALRAELANLHARIFSELVDPSDGALDADEQLFDGALAAAHGDVRRAWIVTLTAMLSDLKAVYY
jgi:hypothetical protein